MYVVYVTLIKLILASLIGLHRVTLQLGNFTPLFYKLTGDCLQPMDMMT